MIPVSIPLDLSVFDEIAEGDGLALLRENERFYRAVVLQDRNSMLVVDTMEPAIESVTAAAIGRVSQ